MASTARDRVLIVENDPSVADLIARQALQSSGYETFIVNDASSAIARAQQVNPDVILANLNLLGLSGKDLLVAFAAQGITAPTIVLAPKGMENAIIKAFRLGAADYLPIPVREAEVINVVERAMIQVRERRERERLAHQVQQTNMELQMRVRELTAIFALGKAVTSITDQALLFERILTGAVQVSQADLGWFLVKDDASRIFTLAAKYNLPSILDELLNKPWDDGVSSLVSMSGESLTVHGEPLRRFKIVSLGQSALIVPIKSAKQVLGIITVMRRQPQPFNRSEQNLLEAVADYASISLVNARLFRSVEDRARSLQALADTAQAGEKINYTILQTVRDEMNSSIETIRQNLKGFDRSMLVHLSGEQKKFLVEIFDRMNELGHIVEAITPIQAVSGEANSSAPLNEIVKQTISRLGFFAGKYDMALTTEIPSETLKAHVDSFKISQALNGLCCHTIRNCPNGTKIHVRLEKTPDQCLHLIVSDNGPGMDASQTARLFDDGSPPETNHRVTGYGARLSLVREMILNQKGKIWVECKPGEGTRYHIVLPSART